MFALRTTLRRAQPMASRVIVPARPFSLSAIRLWNANEGVSYPEFKKYTQQPSDDVLVIDTREPDEASMSPIPSAVNVPFSRVPEVFKEDFHPGQFQQEFAFPKPMPNQKMIFLDRAAKRADAAVEAAKKAGFSQARAYGGGSKEFHQKSKKDGDDH